MNFNELANIDKYLYIQNKYPTKKIIYSLFDKNTHLINPNNIYKDDDIYTSLKQDIFLNINKYSFILNKYPCYADILLKTDEIYKDDGIRYLEKTTVYFKDNIYYCDIFLGF